MQDQTLVNLLAELKQAYDVVPPEQHHTPIFDSRSRWRGLGMFVAAWVLTLLQAQYPSLWLVFAALILMVLGVCQLVALVLADANRTWREIETSLGADAVSPLGPAMARWHDTVLHLRKTYSAEQIAFAETYVTDVASQLRTRVGFLVGGLDRVGLLPLLGTAGYMLVNGVTKGAVSPKWMTSLLGGACLYFVVFHFVGIAFRLERFAVILKKAAPEHP